MDGSSIVTGIEARLGAKGLESLVVDIGLAGHCIVDPTREALRGAADANREYARHYRRIESSLDAAIGTTVLGLRNGSRALRFLFFKIRPLGQNAHRSAHGAFYEQRPLRIAQNFNAVEIHARTSGAICTATPVNGKSLR